MKYNKFGRIFISIFVFGNIKYSLQLHVDTYKIIIGNHNEALECFRNPTRDYCSAVSTYMQNLNSDINDKVTTKYASNIIEAIRTASWNIPILNLENGEIDTSIYKISPPSIIKEIKLSYNIPLKQSVVSIPDNFIRYLTSCPFIDIDDITVSNCSAKLKSLCSSAITCKTVTTSSSISQSNNSGNDKTTVENKNNNNDNTNTSPSNNTGSTNSNTNNNPSSNTSTNTNTNTSNNNKVNNNTDNSSTSTTNNNQNNSNNKTNSDDTKDPTDNDDTTVNQEDDTTGDNKANVTNSDNSSSNSPEIGSAETNVQNMDDNTNSSNTKSLFETFMFGLFTSVGVLVLILIAICIFQSYSNKNIVNLKKITEYYENKPLVHNTGKSNSSSMNDTASGTHSTSNYAISSSSQTSYTNPKHKRYLYVFDDGSVMMSKNNRAIQQGNNTLVNSTNGTQLSTNSINVYNNNVVQPPPSKLSVSTAVSPPMVSTNPNSPMIGSPIVESPAKAFNRNSINFTLPTQIQQPPEVHNNIQ